MRIKNMRWKKYVFEAEKPVRQKKYIFAAEKSCSLLDYARRMGKQRQERVCMALRLQDKVDAEDGLSV